MKTNIVRLAFLAAGLEAFSLASAQVQQAWVARYSSPANSTAAAAAMTVDGSGIVLVTGSLRGTNGASDYLTVKYDANGTQLWAQSYDGPSNSVDFASALATDGAGNVYVTGISDRSPGGQDGAIATIKYDSTGHLLWVAR